MSYDDVGFRYNVGCELDKRLIIALMRSNLENSEAATRAARNARTTLSMVRSIVEKMELKPCSREIYSMGRPSNAQATSSSQFEDLGTYYRQEPGDTHQLVSTPLQSIKAQEKCLVMRAKNAKRRAEWQNKYRVLHFMWVRN